MMPKMTDSRSADLFSYDDFYRYYLEVLGWSPATLPQEVVDTGERDGVTWLSRDRRFPCQFKACFYLVGNVALQKHLGGISDDVYRQGKLQDHVITPPAWDPQCNNFAATAALTTEQKHAICQAHSAFIFGNSQHVSSYEPIINLVHYPCHLAIFSGKQLIVRKGHPLITKAQYDGEPVVLFFDRLLMESGAVINCLSDTSIYVGELLQFDGEIDNIVPAAELTDAQPVLIHSLGEDGKPATPGEPGQNGQHGVSGQPAEDGNRYCAIPAAAGGPGCAGFPGKHGGNGSRGEDAFYISLKVGYLQANVMLCSYGGNGSQGAGGGSGGEGGDGGSGGARSRFCPAGTVGLGGAGGNGGNSGSGGNVGDGRNIYISCWRYAENSRFVLQPSRQQPGRAGKGGAGGKGGLPGGLGGQPGAEGETGRPGRLGIVFENMQPLKPAYD